MRHTLKATWRRVGALAAAAAVLVGCSGGAGGPLVTKSQAPVATPGIRWDSNQPPDLPGLAASRTGALAFSVDTGEQPGLKTASLPSATAKVVLELASDALATLYSVDILPSQFANGAVLFTVYSLPSGLYTVSAAVKDGSNANLAAGATTATVVAGVTTPVTLLLTTDSGNTTGAVKVSIDTTSGGTAAAVPTLPSTGKVLQTIALAPGSRPAALTVDYQGKLWVANYGADQVQKVDLSTATPTITTVVSTITEPLGIAADNASPNPQIWITHKLMPASPFPRAES